MHRAGGAARTGVVGTAVGIVAFFDGAITGLPTALLAATFSPLAVYVAVTLAVIALITACCTWLERSLDGWVAGNGTRVTKRLDGLGRQPTDAAPDRVGRARVRPLVRARGGRDEPDPGRRVLPPRERGAGRAAPDRARRGGLRDPYVALWSLVGIAVGETARAV